eukprot:scaffold258803_cov26-Tisochrysis_lutea.AAC.1
MAAKAHAASLPRLARARAAGVSVEPSARVRNFSFRTQFLATSRAGTKATLREMTKNKIKLIKLFLR